ncbi:MAG: ABC-2 family transporter protein [Nitrospinae bacterium]|nr:ABC-2 family transporter protein [Nitrospinota bacterium]
MRDLAVYLKLMVSAVRAKMEYRFTFLFMFLAIVVFYLGQLGVVIVALARFTNINGWNAGEMAFLYGLLVFSQGVATALFAPLANFESLIISGDFDRYLVRPLNPLAQVVTGSFEINSVAHLMIGSAALYYGSRLAGLEWNLGRLLFFAAVMAGAALIHGGVRLAVSAVAFWTLRNRSLVHMIVYSSKEFVIYPVSIYKMWIQVFLTVVFPIAFINFYPSHYFLAKDPSALFHPYLQYLTPLAGLVVFALAHMLWKKGIDQYQSAGS